MDMNEFFGDAWPSGLCDDGHQVATPLGRACALCGEKIAKGDRGSFINSLGGPLGYVREPVHRECSLRSVLGGIEHLTAPAGHPVGSCYDGSTLTYRESSLQAWDWYQKKHGIPAQ